MYVHANEAPFTTKKVYIVIMRKSRLRNKFLKDSTQTNKKF